MQTLGMPSPAAGRPDATVPIFDLGDQQEPQQQQRKRTYATFSFASADAGFAAGRLM